MCVWIRLSTLPSVLKLAKVERESVVMCSVEYCSGTANGGKGLKKGALRKYDE